MKSDQQTCKPQKSKRDEWDPYIIISFFKTLILKIENPTLAIINLKELRTILISFHETTFYK